MALVVSARLARNNLFRLPYLTFFNVDIYNSFINKITNLNRLNIKMKKKKKKKKTIKRKITTTMDINIQSKYSVVLNCRGGVTLQFFENFDPHFILLFTL